MTGRLRGWRLLLFARCGHASRIDSDEWDGPIAADRWWAARLHRLVCGPCRGERRSMRWLRDVLERHAVEPREAAAPVRLSSSAAARIGAALRAETQSRPKDSGEFL